MTTLQELGERVHKLYLGIIGKSPIKQKEADYNLQEERSLALNLVNTVVENANLETGEMAVELINNYMGIERMVGDTHRALLYPDAEQTKITETLTILNNPEIVNKIKKTKEKHGQCGSKAIVETVWSTLNLESTKQVADALYRNYSPDYEESVDYLIEGIQNPEVLSKSISVADMYKDPARAMSLISKYSRKGDYDIQKHEKRANEIIEFIEYLTKTNENERIIQILGTYSNLRFKKEAPLDDAVEIIKFAINTNKEDVLNKTIELIESRKDWKVAEVKKQISHW